MISRDVDFLDLRDTVKVSLRGEDGFVILDVLDGDDCHSYERYNAGTVCGTFRTTIVLASIFESQTSI